MADVTTTHPTHNAAGSQTGSVLMKLVDNGDGTYSQAVSSSATGTASSQVQGNVASGATDAGNPVKVGGVYNLAPATVTDGQRVNLQTDSKGSLRTALVATDGITPATVALTPTDAQSNVLSALWTFARQYIFNGATWDRQVKPNATSRLLSSAATTNATVVKASAGNLHRIIGENTNAAKRYLKLYNKATSPTVGTDTPALTFVLQATAAFDIDLGAFGQYFSTGIGYAITTAAADADTGAVSAGDIAAMNITYS